MKKLSTIVITAIASTLSVTGINVNAAIWRVSDLSEEHQSLIGTQESIDFSGYDFINEYYSSLYAGHKIFNYNADLGLYYYIGIDSKQFSLTVDPLVDSLIAENKIYTALNMLDTEYTVSSHENEYIISINDLNYNTLLNARLICDELKDQGLITSFYYHGDHYTNVTVMETPYLTSYWYTTEEDAVKIENALNSVIEKYSLDWYILRADEPSEYTTENPYTEEQITVDSFYKDSTGVVTSLFKETSICLVPNGEVSTKEQSEIAQLVLDETGYSANVAFNQSIPDIDVQMYNLDLLNLRYGDLDGDSAVNALDASLVLTYYSNSQTGNTEIYSDEEIADISLLGDYDGDGAVNALDASLVLKEYAETQTA